VKWIRKVLSLKLVSYLNPAAPATILACDTVLTLGFNDISQGYSRTLWLDEVVEIRSSELRKCDIFLDNDRMQSRIPSIQQKVFFSSMGISLARRLSSLSFGLIAEHSALTTPNGSPSDVIATIECKCNPLLFAPV